MRPGRTVAAPSSITCAPDGGGCVPAVYTSRIRLPRITISAFRSGRVLVPSMSDPARTITVGVAMLAAGVAVGSCAMHRRARHKAMAPRSEEHTSELQSHSDLVCRLLLEKK